MIIYLSLIALALVLFITLYVSVRSKAGFLAMQNNFLQEKCSQLEDEKIELIKRVEALSQENKYNENALKNKDLLRQDFLQASKASIHDLGTKLMSEMAKQQRESAAQANEETKKNLQGAAEKFNAEFERVISMMGALSKDINESKKTADFLKTSLLSPASAGALSEITLANILKSSGLKKDTDYFLQYSIASDNGRLRPDAVVLLPSDNIMIIDSKASKFFLESSKASLKKTMNLHLKSLLDKDYTKTIDAKFGSGKVGKIINLMFLPTEQAIDKINEADPTFMDSAWQHDIFPVGPSGLINMLSFAKFQINDFQRAQNIKIIMGEVKKLLASISSLGMHSEKIGANLQTLVSNYDKFAASFNRNFLSRARAVRALGVDLPQKDDVEKNLKRYHLVSAQSELAQYSETEENKTTAQ